MELSDLKKLELRPVEADFNGLKILVNVNAVTGRHFRDAADQIRQAENAQKAEAKHQLEIAEEKDKIQREIDTLKASDVDSAEMRAEQSEHIGTLQKQLDALEPSALEVFEGRGKETENLCALYASLIKGTDDAPLLMSWDLTHNGDPVECSVIELQKRHPELLRDLYDFCVRVDRPKEQETRTTPPNRTISEISGGVTPIPETQPDADLSTLTN
jgi:hypothetical protein